MPSMTFAIMGSLTNSTLTTEPLQISAILRNCPRALTWLWAVLMVFDINNQNSPASIEEDQINKPSRPIASGRIHPTEASWLLQGIILLSLGLGYVTGVMQETVALFALYWAYDNQSGNENWFMRNLLAAGGYIFYALGSLTIVSGHTDTRDARLWMLIFGLVILSTIHAQDFRDMEGDALKGRTTIPLLMGPESARWTLAVILLFWSVICPYYLGLSRYSYFIPVALGGFTGLKFVRNIDTASDKKSFHLYCIWVSVMLQLPAIKLM